MLVILKTNNSNIKLSIYDPVKKLINPVPKKIMKHKNKDKALDLFCNKKLYTKKKLRNEYKESKKPLKYFEIKILIVPKLKTKSKKKTTFVMI